MAHMQNSKKWFELKTRLAKNCTIDKFGSEGQPDICGTQAAMKPELALAWCNFHKRKSLLVLMKNPFSRIHQLIT
jgi:hypothetical protein